MPPAARVGDMHTCPMFDGPKPHVGGPIMPPGAPTVLIGGMPAARVGDMCTCVGPPATIAMGSSKVMIGGMPAARMGDSTAHGGMITLGAPTVMINYARRRPHRRRVADRAARHVEARASTGAWTLGSTTPSTSDSRPAHAG